MDRFSEMIEKGIASREYKTFLPGTPENDPIVKTYNNCFGLFTDTHMAKLNESEYVITGSLCRTPDKFDSFLYSVNYGLGTLFKVNGKITSLSGFLGSKGLRGQYECLNGDKVYHIVPGVPGIDGNCAYGVCGMDTQCNYPVQLGEKLVEVLSTIVENSKDLSELEKQVNESEQINGNDWNAFSTSNGFGISSDTIGKAVLFTEAKEKVVKRYKITDHYSPLFGGRDREYTSEGTLEELIAYHKYTLETGKSYEHEKGNKKINLNPKTIQQLCDNLVKAKDNAARNGYGGHSYDWEEIQ